jgi:ubiquinone/menaquinone biosynthesis C-methylase UbiE/glycosyltransferase involved in cell wall biosynthesis
MNKEERKESDSLNLEWTGERYVPQLRGVIALEHLHRYAYASEYVEGKVVLDIASGEGYGSEMLSRKARFVYGVDIDNKSVLHAARKYKKENLEFIVGSCKRIPLPDNSVDIVVSFETIEHTSEHDSFLLEVKRVLKPDGFLIISSPEKTDYHENRNDNNPYHLLELDFKEFRDLLVRHFQNACFFGQRIISGSQIYNFDKDIHPKSAYELSQLPSKIDKTQSELKPTYILAICSNSKMQNAYGSFCIQKPWETDYCHELNLRIVSKEKELDQLTFNIEGLQQEVGRRDVHIEGLQQEVGRRDVHIEGLQQEVGRRDGQIEGLQQEVGQRDAQIEGLNQAVGQRDAQIEGLQRVINGMRQSTSWKLTGPLRFIGHLLHGNYKSAPTILKKFSFSNYRKMNMFFVRLNRLWIAACILTKHRKSGFFDPEWYLKNNPDVRAATQRPFLHFAFHGFFEGRSPNSYTGGKFRKDFLHNNVKLLNYASRLSDKNKAEDLFMYHYEKIKSLNPSKPSILLVTHEISRTGAPILVLNLAKSFNEDFNVIVVSLGGGELINGFLNHCDLIIGPLSNTKYSSKDVMSKFFSLLNEKLNFEWAIVNSIVSNQAVVALDEAEIPVVHLIHEFPSYTKPDDVFIESSIHSAKQIYSSQLLLDDVLNKYPNISACKPIALSQGRCLVPDKDGSLTKSVDSANSNSIDNSNKTFLVIGMGYVQIRKGVDHFIECCRIVTRKCPEKNIKFIWYGDGYNPEYDLNYSIYLKDQIERSGIDSQFEFRPATDDLESIYKEADLLLLTSRLDPLPLVSQDMMHYGKPVLCFDRSTGLAEFLSQRDETKCCVLPYGDITAMAELIVEFFMAPNRLAAVGKACKELCNLYFNFETYCDSLKKIGSNIKQKKIELQNLEKELLACAAIDTNFLKSKTHHLYQAGSEREYLKGMMKLAHPRRPFPGFNPKSYLDDNQPSKEPTLDYVQNGLPKGRWQIKCIDLATETPIKTKIKAALHLHIFYIEMAENMASRIAKSKSRVPLFVSICDYKHESQIRKIFSDFQLIIEQVRVVPNRGRDIGPLLTEFARELSKYDVIGHAHTKKSVALSDPHFTCEWSNLLLENILGGSCSAIDIVLAQFEQNPRLGLVYPADPYITGWDKNKKHAINLLEKLKLSHINLPENFDYPTGNMFWIRTRAIQQILSENLQWEDYPSEPLCDDGSLLHAIERIWPFVVTNRGYEQLTTQVRGFSR